MAQEAAVLDSKTENELKDQLEDVRFLLKGREWGIWVNFLKKDRYKYLQKKVNESVEAKDMDKAQCFMALLKDCDRQIKVFTSSVESLEKEIKKRKGE